MYDTQSFKGGGMKLLKSNVCNKGMSFCFQNVKDVAIMKVECHIANEIKLLW